MSPPIVERLNAKLIGAPDRFLTILLIAIAIIVTVIAIRGKPYAKAIIATWLLAP
jgi:hypothetical protein